MYTLGIATIKLISMPFTVPIYHFPILSILKFIITDGCVFSVGNIFHLPLWRERIAFSLLCCSLLAFHPLTSFIGLLKTQSGQYLCFTVSDSATCQLDRM